MTASRTPCPTTYLQTALIRSNYNLIERPTRSCSPAVLYTGVMSAHLTPQVGQNQEITQFFHICLQEKPSKNKKNTRGTYTFASCQSEGQSINFDYLEMRNFFPAVVETWCAEHGAQRAHQLYLKPVPNIMTTLKKKRTWKNSTQNKLLKMSQPPSGASIRNCLGFQCLD